MKLTITEIKTAPQNITIRASEYYTLKRKAEAYDNISTTSRRNISNFNARRTPQERTDAARRAALTRWSKKP